MPAGPEAATAGAAGARAPAVERRDYGAFVVGIQLDARTGTAAVALGDGRLVLEPLAGGEPRTIEAHQGAILALAERRHPLGIVTTGDDGRVVATSPEGAPRTLLEVPRRWIERIAVAPETGLIAVAAAKAVHVIAADGSPATRFEDHPSAVGGIAFHPKGRRIAVAHYGGVSLWWTAAQQQEAKRLAWKGSHIAAAWDPSGRYVVTATQENELHGWRLTDAADMRMSGYAIKVKSMGWTADGRFLATSGADLVVAWDFSGRGPMGRPPVEGGTPRESVVTQVAPHPRTAAAVAAGYEDGAVVLARLGGREVALPASGDAPVTALAWAADGRVLAAGAEDGKVAFYRF